MNDQTRGEEPGAGPGLDVPLKRDRKRLRSSKPLPPHEADPTPAPQAGDYREPSLRESAEPQLDEPELSPAEQLFAGQWTASLPPAMMPASTIPPEPLAIPDAVEPHHDDVDLTEDAEPTPTTPYVPPGGFSGPAHPQLGPLAPVPLRAHPGLRTLDIAAFVAAVILPPVGLITAVVAIIRGKRVRGWASDLARAAVSISLVMTVVFVGVGGYVWATETEKAQELAAVKAEQRAHDRVEEASAPFCEVLAANPTIYASADPDYGWPALDAPGGYNAAIAEYAAVWAQIAEVAPEGIAEETAAISARVNKVVGIANALGAANRPGDLLGLHEQTDLATVESWYVEYCDAPEIPAE